MKRTTKPAAQPGADNLALKTESRIEAYKQSMFDALTAETDMLTVWYTRFFESHTKRERRDTALFENKSEKARAHQLARVAAWERAQELFTTLAPVVLHELAQDIAAQVQAETMNQSELAAADVSADIRNVNIFELSRYDDN